METLIAAFFLGVGIGFFASWSARENIFNQPWLICQNCKYKQNAEDGCSLETEKEKPPICRRL